MKTRKTMGLAAGHYSFSVYKENGSLVPEKGNIFSKNIVTDWGVGDLLYEGDLDNSTEIVVGNGTEEISSSATALGSRIAMADAESPTVEWTDHGDGTGTLSSTWTASFSIGDFDGEQLSEVGLFDDYPLNEKLQAGQLIKDENGDPTTVTILSDEQLVVDYVVEFLLSTEVETIKTGSVSVKEEDVDYSVYLYPFFDDVADGDYVPRMQGLETVRFVDDQGGLLFEDDSGAPTVSISGATCTISLDKTWGPTSFSASSLKWVVLGRNDNLPDLTETIEGGAEHTCVVFEFGTPLGKSDTEALTLDLTVELEVTRG